LVFKSLSTNEYEEKKEAQEDIKREKERERKRRAGGGEKHIQAASAPETDPKKRTISPPPKKKKDAERGLRTVLSPARFPVQLSARDAFFELGPVGLSVGEEGGQLVPSAGAGRDMFLNPPSKKTPRAHEKHVNLSFFFSFARNNSL
jgi:hypothetical protein